MTRPIRISEDLALPLDMVTESISVLAIKRAGKSYFARKLAEQLFHAGQQIVICDPKGDTWGIRSSADGKGPGLPIVILGGEHGDVPLEAGGGELVARMVVQERVSVLLDLASFRKHEVATFMTGFLETLYRMKAKEEYRTAMMLIVDEADAIAPQRPMRGEERMLGAAEDIVRRGGQRGIGITLVTQRAAVLNKNVLSQCGILVFLRMLGLHDIEGVDDWIQKHGQPEQKAKLLADIASLPRGTAWWWSPGWPDEKGIFKRIEISRIETFDSGATPKPGERRITPKSVADVDLEAFRREMAAMIEKAKADDPRELRRRIVELEQAARKRVDNSQQPVEKQPRRVEVPILKDAQIKRLEVQAQRLESLRGQFEKHTNSLAKRLAEIYTEASAGLKDLEASVRVFLAPTASRPAPAPSQPRAAIAVSDRPNPSRPIAQSVGQRILNALAELEQMGANEPDRELVAFLSGYSNVTSKGFANAIGALRTDGLIDYPTQGAIVLTESGRAQAQPPARPRSPEDVQQRIVSMLGGASERILAPLINVYPKAIGREELAARAGYGNVTSKGFANAIGRLRTLGFVTYPDRGSIKAAPILFLETK